MTASDSEAKRILPDWITSELLAETVSVWQPFYAEGLTEVEAIEILLAVGHLFDAWGDSGNEAVSCTSTRI